MQRGLTGHFVSVHSGSERCRAFVPKPLPPVPPLIWDTELLDLHAHATLAAGDRREVWPSIRLPSLPENPQRRHRTTAMKMPPSNHQQKLNTLAGKATEEDKDEIVK